MANGPAIFGVIMPRWGTIGAIFAVIRRYSGFGGGQPKAAIFSDIWRYNASLGNNRGDIRRYSALFGTWGGQPKAAIFGDIWRYNASLGNNRGDIRRYSALFGLWGWGPGGSFRWQLVGLYRSQSHGCLPPTLGRYECRMPYLMLLELWAPGIEQRNFYMHGYMVWLLH